MSEKRCYTVQELQEILGVSRPTIYNLLKKKEFRWIQLDGGKYRISKKSFDNWLDNLEQLKNRVLIRQILSAIDILNFYLDLRYDIRKNTNTKKDRK